MIQFANSQQKLLIERSILHDIIEIIFDLLGHEDIE